MLCYGHRKLLDGPTNRNLERMNPRAFVKRSIVLTCAYYLFDDWRARRRLACGDLATRSGSRHASLDIEASLRYIDRIHDDYLAYAGRESLGGVIAEIGPGGNFLASPHTLARYKDAFFQSQLFDSTSFEQWRDNGSPDAAQRADTHVRATLAEFEPPALDGAIDEALLDFIARRKSEMPDSFA